MDLKQTSSYKINVLSRASKVAGYTLAVFGILLTLLASVKGFSYLFGIVIFLVGAAGITYHYISKAQVKDALNALEGFEKSKLELELTKFDDRFSSVVTKVFSYIFLTFFAVLAFLPFYWMVMSSVKTEMEYRRNVPTFFPHEFQFKNYSMVLSQTGSGGTNFWQILINTLVVGILSTSLGVIVCIITAYALARMNFKGKNLLFTLMLGTMMIPGEMFTLTNYITTVGVLHWQDTFTILILPFLVSIYYIYLLRNNFMQIPNSLYQAAKVDGLSDMGYLIKVMIPLTAPTLISVTLLKFIGTWNTYIWPRLVNHQNWQLVTNWVTSSFTDRGNVLYNGFYNASEALTTLKMAAVCIVSLPLFVLFISFRKYIMRGVSKSGTKG